MRRMSKTKKYVALLLASAMFLSTAVSGTAQDGSSVILYDIGGYSWLLYVDGSTLTGYLYDHGLNAWPVQGTVAGLEPKGREPLFHCIGGICRHGKGCLRCYGRNTEGIRSDIRI